MAYRSTTTLDSVPINGVGLKEFSHPPRVPCAPCARQQWREGEEGGCGPHRRIGTHKVEKLKGPKGVEERTPQHLVFFHHGERERAAASATP